MMRGSLFFGALFVLLMAAAACAPSPRTEAPAAAEPAIAAEDESYQANALSEEAPPPPTAEPAIAGESAAEAEAGQADTVAEEAPAEVHAAPAGPAAESLEENAAAPALLAPTPTPATTYPATAAVMTTPQPLQPTPTAVIEERIVELEWPPRMRMGESDVVRLSLMPSKDGYVVEAEFEEHAIESQEAYIKRPYGYDLYAIARLDGVGFIISPQGERTLIVLPDEKTEWRWSITPNAAGQQRLSVGLSLRWEPQADSGAEMRHEAYAYGSGMDVQVVTFLGLGRPQALGGGLTGLLVGGGLSLTALGLGKTRHKKARGPAPNGGQTAATSTRIDASQLTANEHRLLIYLQAHSGKVCAKDDLIRAVWSEEVIIEGLRDDSLAQLVRRLRQKIEADPSKPRFIHTAPGRGYMYRQDG